MVMRYVMPSRGMMTSSALAAFQFWWSASPRPATVPLKAIVSQEEHFLRFIRLNDTFGIWADGFLNVLQHFLPVHKIPCGKSPLYGLKNGGVGFDPGNT
jgi:hypothetical protein